MGWWGTISTNSCQRQPFSPQHGWTLLHQVCCKALVDQRQLHCLFCHGGLSTCAFLGRSCQTGLASVSPELSETPVGFKKMCVLTLDAQKCVYFEINASRLPKVYPWSCQRRQLWPPACLPKKSTAADALLTNTRWMIGIRIKSGLWTDMQIMGSIFWGVQDRERISWLIF